MMKSLVLPEKSLHPSRAIALIEITLATIFWSSSFVFVEIALRDLGPLSVAGMRYFISFLALLPFLIKNNSAIRKISRRNWLLLIVIGLSAHVICNGTFIYAQKYLSATTTSFMMNISPVFVMLAGMAWLKETPSITKLLGVVLTLLGSFLYFYRNINGNEPIGLVLTFIGIVGFASSGVLTRFVAREGGVDTLTLTTIPIGVGGGLLLLLAFFIEKPSNISLQTSVIILWLAIVNTSIAYMLYNHSLKTLTALESNVVLSLSPIGTALLSRIIFGERLDIIKGVGLLIVIFGVFMVQARQKILSRTP